MDSLREYIPYQLSGSITFPQYIEHSYESFRIVDLDYAYKSTKSNKSKLNEIVVLESSRLEFDADKVRIRGEHGADTCQ